MSYQSLIERYAAGPQLLRKAVAGMSREQLHARPIAGKWSTIEVVCHLSDFEPIYADRMKRVIAEEIPLILSGNPDLFQRKLAYEARDVDEELALVEAVRKQMVRILKGLGPVDFQRTGRHSEDGPLTLETLLTRITEHLPHHTKFIDEKRKAMGA